MFEVTSVESGDHIIVSPKWVWQGYSGNRVVVFGYTTPAFGMANYEFAKKKLSALIAGREIELKDPKFFQKFGTNTLVCRVYLDGVDIANYFPEFKSPSSFLKGYTG